MFGVLQLSYFTLGSHSFLNSYLEPFVGFKSFNGVNVGVVRESSELPEGIARLGLSGTFINNCNIMLILLFGQLILAFSIYIVAKIKSNARLQYIGNRFLKQGFMTLILFNVFNISFSAGVHWKYAQTSDDGYLWSSFLLYLTLISIIVSVFAMELTSKSGYGEFKDRFKTVWIC